MFEREIERYNTLLREYKTTVIDKFNVEDLKEYNEILFSAHSCAIEGNTFSVDDTRALKEKGLVLIKPVRHPVPYQCMRYWITSMRMIF